MPFLVDKILQRQRAGCDPASGAEEHSPVIFNESLIVFVTSAAIIALLKLRDGRIFILSQDFNKTRLFDGYHL